MAGRTTREWANFYRELGYQPLPSDPNRKKPLVKFKQWWEADAPHEELWDRNPTTNIQIMCGRYWGLAVIDLDGPEAQEVWPTMGRFFPRTWETVSGGGGRHVWYTIPRDLPQEIRRLRLWGIWDPAANQGKGDWEHHKAIELLCDRSLVMAPPSIHPTSKRVYQFLRGRSPVTIPRPAPIPAWVLGLKPMEAPRPVIPDVPRKAPVRPMAGRWDWNAVLDAIPSKVAVAQSWGLRFASAAQPSDGWVSVHDIDREDRNPSARFHPQLGRFWRPGERTMSLFDLGVALGVFATAREAMESLATEFNVPTR